MDLFKFLFIFQIFIVSSILLIATIQDIKTRMVYDWVWWIGFVFSLVLHLIGIIFVANYPWVTLLLNLGLAIIFIGLFSIPKLFGGSLLMGPADLIGIFIIAFCLPFQSPLIVYQHTILFYVPSIFSVITNSFVLFALFLLFNLCKNGLKYLYLDSIKKSEPNWFKEFANLSWFKKFLLCTLGNRLSISKLTQFSYVKFLEEYVEETSQWRFSFDLGYEDEFSKEEMIDMESSIRDLGLSEIWISPMVPLITFFLLGVLVSFLAGNLVFKFLEIF